MSFLLRKGHGKEPLPLVQFADFGHFVIGQGKIENIEIILHVLRVRGFREDDVSLLNMPAQNDLSIALAVFLTKPCKQRFI